MNGIFYFSSTGNSLYIAEQIKAELGGEIRYIPKFAGEVNAYDKIIIVSPIHSFGLPTLVYDFFSNMNSTKPLYIVLNCGGMQANAPYYTYQLCKEKGLSIRSVQVVMMPEKIDNSEISSMYFTVFIMIITRPLLPMMLIWQLLHP
jgi:flavodoxin